MTEPVLPATFWPLAGRIALLIGLEALFALIVKTLRRGASASRATIWLRGATFVGIAALYFAVCGLGPIPFAVLLAVIGIQAVREVVAVLRRAGWRTSPALAAALAYVGLPLGLVVLLRRADAGFALVVWTTAIVGICDVTSMFGGLAFGRHRLIPRLSPAKTLEGTVAGLLGALVAAALLRFALPPVPAAAYYAAALLVALAGNAGDLFASAIKRAGGVKDFGAALPGHGGIMDRIDSLLFAVPMVWVARLTLGAP